MKKCTVFDLIITIFLIMIIFLLIYYNFINKNNLKSELLIKTSDAEYFYNLDQKKVIEIKGSLGITIIEIENGRFRFVESPCSHKDCVRMGWVSFPNFPVICLPNQVSGFIVEKKENILYDGITQ